jgi:hypothetical protein
MVRVLFIFLFSAFSLAAIGQNSSIELSFIMRYDKHADFTTRYGFRSFTDNIKLWGVSHGLQFNYLHPIVKGLKLSAGAAYYRLDIDKIECTASTKGAIPARGRTIDYTHPAGIEPLFSTDRYHYNNLALSVGISYERRLPDKTTLITGADYTYLHTFSQSYHMPGLRKKEYKTDDAKKLGFSANAYVGILKKNKSRKYYIAPKIIIPVYQQLAGNKVFFEDESVKMVKWMNGAGLSISMGRYL